MKYSSRSSRAKFNKLVWLEQSHLLQYLENEIISHTSNLGKRYLGKSVPERCDIDLILVDIIQEIGRSPKRAKRGDLLLLKEIPYSITYEIDHFSVTEEWIKKQVVNDLGIDKIANLAITATLLNWKDHIQNVAFRKGYKYVDIYSAVGENYASFNAYLRNLKRS